MKRSILVAIALLASSVASAVTWQEVENYKKVGGGQYDTYVHDESDQVPINYQNLMVVSQDAGTSCPAGTWFVINHANRTYTPVDKLGCKEGIRPFYRETKNGKVYVDFYRGKKVVQTISGPR